MQEILFALWFFAPAGIANSSPVFANKIPLLNKLGMPIDGGKTFRGKRIFGDHKTLRGFIVGTIAGFLVALLQMLLYTNFSWFNELSSSVDYSDPIVLVMGAALGFGALTGDAIKSFFKRQFSVPSGESWFPFDQIDYIVGGLFASAFFVSLALSQYVTITIVWFLIHPIATFIGWLLKLKDSPI
jgi:CDP-2,3-bis-(O-geranylgeranyl)-sn-glycerol synthase